MRHEDAYHHLFHASMDAMVRINAQEIIEEVNTSFMGLFGYKADEVVGRKLDDCLVCPILKSEASNLNHRIACGEVFTTDSVRVDKFGRQHHVFITGIPIMTEEAFCGAYVIYRNRTFEVESERKLFNQKVAFESLFRNSHDAIVRIDINQRVIDINERFEILFGYKLDEIKGKEVDKLIANEAVLGDSIELTNRLMSGEKVSVEGLRYSKNGSARMYFVQGVPIIAAGVIIGGYGIYTDITERKAAEEKAFFMSYHDQLTGLYNRRFFEVEFERLSTERNMPMSLVMGDVNGLKLINDAFGHGSGDEFLKRIAVTLRDNYREGELIARLGGDEFVILLPQTSLAVTEKIVQRLKAALSRERFKGLELSMAFGFGCKCDQVESNLHLFNRVEDDMYRNKLVESPAVKSQMFNTVIQTLHNKNEREELHSIVVSEYCKQIAEALMMSPRFILEMKTIGWLHDIGKIAVSDKILDKVGSLTDAEWKKVKKHSEIGYRILNSIHEFTELSEFILYHHERYDGSGYPKGLQREEIPLQSRILAVADAYEAMTHNRTYREALTPEEAIDELLRNSGTQFDPAIVKSFVTLIKEGYIKGL